MWLNRSLGIALHPTSLPGGRLGPEAYAVVDWIAAAGGRWWQVLPLNPPDEFGSPYASASAFAAWPGLLAEPDAPVAPSELRAFEKAHSYWIHDWAAYAGGEAVAEQVRFDREWSALRAYAAVRGVRIIGDVPIYVADGSCDVVAHPDIFVTNGFVAGAPPDPMNELGQTWGNPLYDWEELARTGYRWWTERMRRTLGLVDVFRIDHFRGFAAYWAVPDGVGDARQGHWSPGPGAAVFRAAEAELGALPVIAEDLGVITPDVEELRDRLEFPGMVVLQWAFDGPDHNPHRLENHRVNQVVYTSTHDTDTLRGRFPSQDTWHLLDLALSSPATLAVVPMQDVLGLGSESRINRPGEIGGNWAWRLEPGKPAVEDAERLRGLAVSSSRR